MKIDGKSLTRAAIKEFAPDILQGTIAEWVTGKSVKQFYDFLDASTFWEKIPEGRQYWLLSYRPWNLNWLSLEWLIGAIGKANRSLGYLIGSSPELQTKLQDGINDIKERLEQCAEG